MSQISEQIEADEANLKQKSFSVIFIVPTVHEISAGHWSLSGNISCVTERIRFLPVTMTGRLSNFNSISYKEEIFISGDVLLCALWQRLYNFLNVSYF